MFFGLVTVSTMSLSSHETSLSGYLQGLKDYCFKPVNGDRFSFETSAIVAASVGIGAGLVSLLFVVWLVHRVSHEPMYG